MDGEFDNYATALNQVLLRNGVTPYTGDLKMGGFRVTGLGDGTAGLPAVGFNASPSSGMWSPGVGKVALTAAGISRLEISAAGTIIAGDTTVTGDATINGNITLLGGFGSSIATGAGVGVGNVVFEHGGLRTADGPVIIDMHARPGTDYETRIVRLGGVDGGLVLEQLGAGGFNTTLPGGGAIMWSVLGAERARVDSAGLKVGVVADWTGNSTIVGYSNTINGRAISAYHAGAGPGSAIIQRVENTAANFNQYFLGATGIGSSRTDGVNFIQSAGGAQIFETAGAEKMRIAADGRKYMGTSNDWTTGSELNVTGSGGRSAINAYVAGATGIAVVARTDNVNAPFSEWYYSAGLARIFRTSTDGTNFVQDSTGAQILMVGGAEKARLTAGGVWDVAGIAITRGAHYFGAPAVVNIGGDANTMYPRANSFQFQNAAATLNLLGIDGQGNLTTSTNVGAGNAVVEIGGGRTADGPALIDLHGRTGTDYETRLGRLGGVDGGFFIDNTGAGPLNMQVGAGGVFQIYVGGAVQFQANATALLDKNGRELGNKDMPFNNQGVDYMLTLADRNGMVYLSGGTGVIIPLDATTNFPIGARVDVLNDTPAVKAINFQAGVSLRFSPSAGLGIRSLAVGGWAQLVKVGANAWYVGGFGVS
jgi:hypothetical protein